MVYVPSSEFCGPKRFVWCWNKVEWKYIQERQLNQFHCYNQNMDFVNRIHENVAKYRIGIRSNKMAVVLVFLNGRCRSSGCVGIVLYWQRWKRWVSASSSFSKRCCQWSFSKIFKGKQIILDPSRNSKYLIIYLFWWHKTLPGAICEKEGRYDKLSTPLGEL